MPGTKAGKQIEVKHKFLYPGRVEQDTIKVKTIRLERK
jgi:hypothetical protein